MLRPVAELNRVYSLHLRSFFKFYARFDLDRAKDCTETDGGIQNSIMEAKEFILRQMQPVSLVWVDASTQYELSQTKRLIRPYPMGRSQIWDFDETTNNALYTLTIEAWGMTNHRSLNPSCSMMAYLGQCKFEWQLQVIG